MARRGDPREPYSYLHPGTTVEGDVRAARLRVDGTLRGSVVVDGLLEVAPGGRVEGGPVRAHDVRIAGEVVADVVAEGTVEVWRDGRLEGDVRAGALDVDEGGRFLGRSLALDDPDPEPAPAPLAGSGPGAAEADC
jgi:cytoskeletal protein CcmA (bactofilin family)